ncbi:MAG: MFS transporter [Acidobacteriota bacterium]
MSAGLVARFGHTFRALRHRQFRIFWAGQGISVTGTWMQTMAQSWLVYRLTNSPLALGLLAIARFGPALVGSPIAGVVTDRVSRRNLVLLTQSLSLVQSAVLAGLTLTGRIQVWQVLVLAGVQGIVDTLDMPARQTLQVDLVGIEDLQSAVSLNSSAFNLARMVGPALAGVLVSLYGEGVCFAVNAFSYLTVLVALVAIRLPAGGRVTSGRLGRELREGFRYAWHAPGVRSVLVAVAVTSGLGLSYGTLLPVLARDVLHGGARGYGLLLAGAGLGAIAGALGAASRRSQGGTSLILALGQGALGLGLVGLATTRSLTLATVCMVVVGFAVAAQLTTTNGFLQTTAPPHLRGRVVSLYIWLFTGISPLGGMLAGWAADRVGAPWATAAAGLGCVVSALLAARGIPRERAAFRQTGA